MSRNLLESASIQFRDEDGFARTYNVDLEIAAEVRELEIVPSLLGRDILDRWRMVYDPAQRELTLTVRSADLSVPV